MPIYEYRCPDCGCRSEEFQRVGEGGERLRCRHCRRVGLERRVSTFAARGNSTSGSCYSAPACTGFT